MLDAVPPTSSSTAWSSRWSGRGRAAESVATASGPNIGHVRSSTRRAARGARSSPAASTAGRRLRAAPRLRLLDDPTTSHPFVQNPHELVASGQVRGLSKADTQASRTAPTSTRSSTSARRRPGCSRPATRSPAAADRHPQASTAWPAMTATRRSTCSEPLRLPHLNFPTARGRRVIPRDGGSMSDTTTETQTGQPLSRAGRPCRRAPGRERQEGAQGRAGARKAAERPLPRSSEARRDRAGEPLRLEKAQKRRRRLQEAARRRPPRPSASASPPSRDHRQRRPDPDRSDEETMRAPGALWWNGRLHRLAPSPT
jgi:hypothetical protein